MVGQVHRFGPGFSRTLRFPVHPIQHDVRQETAKMSCPASAFFAAMPSMGADYYLEWRDVVVPPSLKSGVSQSLVSALPRLIPRGCRLQLLLRGYFDGAGSTWYERKRRRNFARFSYGLCFV